MWATPPKFCGVADGSPLRPTRDAPIRGTQAAGFTDTLIIITLSVKATAKFEQGAHFSCSS